MVHYVADASKQGRIETSL